MDATTEVVRNGLKTKLDRRWVGCANPNMCPAMASVVPQAVQQEVGFLPLTALRRHREWLSEQLKRFSGPPNMELRVLDDDEIESRVDHLAVLLRIPMPDSNGSGDWFPVGRLGYASNYRSVEPLRSLVFGMMEALALHECREWMRHDGEHIIDPHPERN